MKVIKLITLLAMGMLLVNCEDDKSVPVSTCPETLAFDMQYFRFHCAPSQLEVLFLVDDSGSVVYEEKVQRIVQQFVNTLVNNPLPDEQWPYDDFQSLKVAMVTSNLVQLFSEGKQCDCASQTALPYDKETHTAACQAIITYEDGCPACKGWIKTQQLEIEGRQVWECTLPAIAAPFYCEDIYGDAAVRSELENQFGWFYCEHRETTEDDPWRVPIYVTASEAAVGDMEKSIESILYCPIEHISENPNCQE